MGTCNSLYIIVFRQKFSNPWCQSFIHTPFMCRDPAMVCSAVDVVERAMLGLAGLGQHVTHADGREVANEDLAHVRRLIWHHTHLFPHAKGDIHVIDNMKVDAPAQTETQNTRTRSHANILPISIRSRTHAPPLIHGVNASYLLRGLVATAQETSRRWSNIPEGPQLRPVRAALQPGSALRTNFKKMLL